MGDILVQNAPAPLQWQVQPELFEGTAGGVMVGVDEAAAAAMEADLGQMMEEEGGGTGARGSGDPAPAQRRRVHGRLEEEQITEISQIFNPRTYASPNPRVNDQITRNLREIDTNPERFEELVVMMFAQLGRTGGRMQVGAALKAMEKRLGTRNIDPNDADNRNLVVIFYVMKRLSEGKPETTDVRRLLD